jgi:hypothetical protein
MFEGWFRRPDLWGQAGRRLFEVSCLKVFPLKIRRAGFWIWERVVFENFEFSNALKT